MIVRTGSEPSAMAFGANLVGNGEADGNAQQRFSLQDGLEADPFQESDHPFRGAFGMESVKVVAALLAIDPTIADEHIEDGEQPVSYGYGCLLDTAPPGQAMEQAGKESVALA